MDEGSFWIFWAFVGDSLLEAAAGIGRSEAIITKKEVVIFGHFETIEVGVIRMSVVFVVFIEVWFSEFADLLFFDFLKEYFAVFDFNYIARYANDALDEILVTFDWGFEYYDVVALRIGDQIKCFVD